jgi:hypothetical protein
MTISRAVALLEVGLVENPKGTSQEKMNLGSLRKRIKDIAAMTRDPDKLFVESPLSIRPELVKRIRNIRDQVAIHRQTDTTATTTRSGLVAALSDLPSGPTDISSLFTRINGTISRDEVLNDLLQLHETGMLRLVIDLPESGDD